MNPVRRASAFAPAGLLAIALAACTALPFLDGAQRERIARVEQGLLPPVLVEGEPSWSLVERLAHHRVPGVSVAVIENFEVAWQKGYGVADASTGTPVDARTLFQAASISKPVAAAAFMRLVDEGKVALDAPVNSVLRSWKVPDNDFTRKQPVTFAHLLSHSAGTTVHGFPGYAADDPVPSLIQVLDGGKPANTAPIRVDKLPGEGFRYSGGGTTVVQQALQDLSGEPFAAFMHATVLKPAAMRRSTYEQPLPAERLPEATAGRLGRLDVLVNNAGIYELHRVLQTTPAAWRAAWQRTLAVNLLGPAHLTHAAAQLMARQRGGRIINVSSRGAFRGEPDAPAYGASKAGLNALSQSMAKALAPHGVYVFAVAPGWVDTDMASPFLGGKAGAAIRRAIPLGRTASSAEIAQTILFLATAAPPSMTGCIVDVNGASYLRS